MNFRQLSNLTLSIAQFLAPSFALITGIGMGINERSTENLWNSPEVPAEYAFGIWFVIFSLALAYSFHQALSSQRDNPLYKSIGFLTAGLFLLGTAWMLLVQIIGDGWYQIPLISGMLYFVLKAFYRLLKHPILLTRFEQWTISPMLGLVSSWLSIAVFLNTASVLKTSTWGTLGFSYNGIAVITLLMAVTFSLYHLRKTQGNLWYGGTTLWGLLGVIIENLFYYPNGLIAFLATIAFFIVVTVTFKSRRNKRDFRYHPSHQQIAS